MTDRSSEERSQFEKWAWKRINSMQVEISINDCWVATLGHEAVAERICQAMNRAALEDRQEPAPDEVAKDAARRLLAGVKAVIASGVPSQATPSKENAPGDKLSCGCTNWCTGHERN